LLTGQQYSIRKEFTANAESRKQKPAQAEKVPQLQRLTRKYTSQVLQPQRITRSTSGTHRGVSRVPPGHGRQDTGRGRKDEGRRKREKTVLKVRQNQTTTRSTGERHQSTTWVRPPLAASNSGTSSVSGRANVRVRPNISRPPASQGSRGRSPSLRRLRLRGRADRVGAV
jgi:hypothetical protein